MRHSQMIFVGLVGLCSLVCSSGGAVIKDPSIGQDTDINATSPKKRDPKKKRPMKRTPSSAERKDPLPIVSAPIPSTAEATPTPNKTPPPTSTAPVLPSAPQKFTGTVKRLCHPVKGKHFYLNARWKKGGVSDIVAYRIYVNGKCEKQITATRKPCFQVLRHTRHVRKAYEIASIDKNGNESGRTRLAVKYRKIDEPLCACCIPGGTINLRQLTPEYLHTLSKERIIELMQQLRKEVQAAHTHGDQHP